MRASDWCSAGIVLGSGPKADAEGSGLTFCARNQTVISEGTRDGPRACHHSIVGHEWSLRRVPLPTPFQRPA